MSDDTTAPVPAGLNPLTPEFHADHIIGITEQHGIARLLLCKHRPVAMTKQDGSSDSVGNLTMESCIISIPSSSLQEFKQKIDQHLKSRKGEKDVS